jgi:hypothetical protein
MLEVALRGLMIVPQTVVVVTRPARAVRIVMGFICITMVMGSLLAWADNSGDMIGVVSP